MTRVATSGLELKEQVREFWNAAPCGTRGLSQTGDSRAFFDAVERQRDEREPFITQFARFGERSGKRLLEVGVGAGTDFLRFAQAGATASGVDYTEASVSLVKRRLELAGLAGDVRVADAEHLPFADGTFDFVYSWGVIHHTPDTRRAASEIIRVVKPGGTICVMIYHRYSLVSLQCWILNALFRLRPWLTLSDVISEHIESPGTKAFTSREARDLFSGLSELRVTTIVTPYDVRYMRTRFLPTWIQRLVPRSLGWFLVVEGRRPSEER